MLELYKNFVLHCFDNGFYVKHGDLYEWNIMHNEDTQQFDLIDDDAFKLTKRTDYNYKNVDDNTQTFLRNYQFQTSKTKDQLTLEIDWQIKTLKTKLNKYLTQND